MFWINTKRIFRSGFANFWRNGFVSLAAVLIMTITLFVIGSIFFVLTALNTTLNTLKDKVDINVYFSPSANETDILSLKDTISGMTEIKSVEYITREQALEDFKTRHKDDQLILQSLEELGANPFGGILNIKAKMPSQYENVAKFLEDGSEKGDFKAEIDKVNFYDNKLAIERLDYIIASSRKVGLGASILFAFLSVLIAFNTIRLAIYINKEEISVMRLVGASNRYVRGPFLVSGVLYGLSAGIITMIIFFPISFWLRKATESFFAGMNFFSFYTSKFGVLALLIIGSGIVLGTFSSFLAVRKHLRI